MCVRAQYNSIPYGEFTNASQYVYAKKLRKSFYLFCGGRRIEGKRYLNQMMNNIIRFRRGNLKVNLHVYVSRPYSERYLSDQFSYWKFRSISFMSSRSERDNSLFDTIKI